MTVREANEGLSASAGKACDSAESLAGRIGGEVLTDCLSRAMYSTDASIYQILPTMIVCPRTPADVAEAVRYAARVGLPVVARGAGSGLAGETLTTGIVLDFSRFANEIVSVDPAARTAVVQMGCVFKRLNDTLAPHKLLFGPDPSSGNRATLGGILGNNATGAHSIRCGYAGDHVNWIDVILADGSAGRFCADGRVEADGPSELRERIVREIPPLLAAWQARVAEHWPKTNRNRAGYNVKGSLNADGTVNWPKLLAGSEGTLAIFTAAEVTLDAAPPVKAVLQVNFDSLTAMARALPAIMAGGCSACELMDRKTLSMARDAHGGPHPHLPDVAASLVIEHDGADADAVKVQLDRTAAVCRGLAGLVGEPLVITDRREQAELWAVRKKAVPLLFRDRSRPQPVPFIEDVAVDIEHMAEYVGQLETILAAEDASVAYYAHAGGGELHIRPFLNLHLPADRERMVRIARRTFELAWRCGGTVSGEHGCGLTRSGFLAAQYGPVYELFRLVKTVFDPDGRLNPGKIVTDKTPNELMTTHLRFDHVVDDALAADTTLVWAPGELTGELEACNGCGECRGLEEQLGMCPIFRARNVEAASPRAKANVFRHILTGLLDETLRRDPSFKAVADLCVNCKSCHLECPSAVNIPKLMLEAKSHFVRHKGLATVEAVLANGELMGKLGSRFGALANLTLKIPGIRWLMEKTMGVERKRPMPPFAFGTFARKARRRAQPAPVDGERVCYFVDLFANYHDHGLGQAVMDVLAHNGIQAVIPPQASAAMPPIDYGTLDAARKVIRRNLARLAPVAEQGYTIVCSEPTAALCLKEEWLDVLRTPEAELVAAHTRELMSFLRDLHRAGRLKTDFQPLDLRLAYHRPCHLKALHAGFPGVELVRLVPGVSVEVIEKGCCGIAGTYGFQHRNYETSLRAGSAMLTALRDSAAPFGLSECSTCKMQMDHATGKYTFHPVKILAKAYGYPVKGWPR